MKEEELMKKEEEVKQFLVDQFGDLVEEKLLRDGFDTFKTFCEHCLRSVKYPIEPSRQGFILALCFIAGYVSGRRKKGKSDDTTTKASSHLPVSPEKYQTITWPMLEKLSSGTCSCCNKQFSASDPPELAGKCHTGPVFVNYWDGYAYLSCHECRKPIGKIPVSTKLI